MNGKRKDRKIMTQNELFEIALTTDPAQIGHHVQGGYMTGIYPISDDIKAIGPAFTIRQCNALLCDETGSQGLHDRNRQNGRQENRLPR